ASRRPCSRPAAVAPSTPRRPRRRADRRQRRRGPEPHGPVIRRGRRADALLSRGSMARSSNQATMRTDGAGDVPLRIIPLGGVGEIGKNMYVIEYGDEIVVIDCGLMFPDEEMFGIDLVIPDITYLKENRAKVKAFLITHAHEDHVGALPYVLPEFPGVPVYASTLARGLLGNKIKEHKLRIATDLGYLKYDPSHIVPKERIKDYPDAKLVICTTGAQGEPMAGLARMANRDHRFVEIQPGDTVIVSASPIPGNEEYVSRTIDNLFKAGANVFYHTIRRAHVSGHASQEELKLMLGLTKPRYFIPIHGEFRMQVQHGRLAIETGVAPENVFIIENGTPIEISADGTARRGQPVPAGYVFVDGLSVGEVGDVVLRDRRALANDGMFMIVVQIDKQTNKLVGRPEIITRGFIHGNQDAQL